MNQAIVVTGTDTDIGKTVFAAALTGALDAHYWKPIQAGLSGETDSGIVQRLGGVPLQRIVPEAYRLTAPASPHFSAEREGIVIDPARLNIPCVAGALVIEGAGGLAVPLTRQLLQIDLFARWKAPVILCAVTKLGTINHSLLSIEALKQRAIPILGIAFIGDANPDSERTVVEMGGVRRLGRLPHVTPLDAQTLRAAFTANFDAGAVLGLGGSGP